MPIERGHIQVEELPLTSVRPELLPGQITDISEVTPGTKFCDMHREELSPRVYTVLEEPEKDKSGEFWVKIETERDAYGKKTIKRISLGDSGVTPYSGNLWNPSNRMIRADQVQQQTQE